ncbi:26S proteasome regulatory complex, non-ATPase subcomplex, Rpn1 subunit [Neoconidiobolus thromboides FSU 785]|nr:26S proteasome regulatory complex, non-ATPase subcomplex, Rpn1 subunit [Neoconidiobolus thromboides FSU 785]
MTSVPKPLKFLIRFFVRLEEVYENWLEDDSNRKVLLADVLSIIGMSYGKQDDRIALKYRLLGSEEDIISWGHEYIRTLALEIGQDLGKIKDTFTDYDEIQNHHKRLYQLTKQIVPFFLKHNAEADAVDLLIESEYIRDIIDLVDEENFKRVCLYMNSCASYYQPHERTEVLKTICAIYLKFKDYPNAMIFAIKLDSYELMEEAFLSSAEDKAVQKQVSYILARQFKAIDTDDERMISIITNTLLHQNFEYMADKLDFKEPKLPKDIYKVHLENHRGGYGGSNLDSAQFNLASSFVNGFVNAGFSNDKLVVNPSEQDDDWIHRNKDDGKLSATASIGLILLWNTDEAFATIDRYTYSDDPYIKAGAFLGMGMACNRLRLESDPALALLGEHVNSNDFYLRMACIMGLGLAYTGSDNPGLTELLSPLVNDPNSDITVASLAALSLGLNNVGQCHNDDVTGPILQTLMERPAEDLDSPFCRFMGLGLALAFLGKPEKIESICETIRAISHPVGNAFLNLLNACAYAGTGDVDIIQSLLNECNEHIDPKKDSDLHQVFAVLGMALVALGEDIGSEMVLRIFGHLMHYGEPVIRRTVPLALGLLCASNPKLNVLDNLSKYSHDNDLDVALNAIFAMGLVGAGTNNARIAQMLRQLAVYYAKENNCLFMVRIAQGLVYMGKGTMSLHPFHTDRNILSSNALTGLLACLLAFTDSKNLILDQAKHFLYYLVTAMYPRFLITVDEEGEHIETTVRVGQAVDTVGQAGNPKTITGFQTHETPVLLSYGERAELATDEYIPVKSILEGVVILKKNPNFIPEVKAEK